MRSDSVGICEQSIERHQRRDRGEQRKNGVKCHAGRQRNDVIISNISVDSQKDVFPPWSRNIGRPFRKSTPVRLVPVL